MPSSLSPPSSHRQLPVSQQPGNPGEAHDDIIDVLDDGGDGGNDGEMGFENGISLCAVEDSRGER